MSDLILMGPNEVPVKKALISMAYPKESLLGLDVEGYAVVMDAEVHRRIVAAVDACSGIPTKTLEEAGHGAVLTIGMSTLTRERDEAIRAIGEEARLRGLAEAERESARVALRELTLASKAVIDRWQSPKWEWSNSPLFH